jgi:hypothetical protein
MKKFAYALRISIAALFILSFSITAYSAEDPPLATPPVDLNNVKCFYGAFYNTLKAPANPPIVNDWIFNGDPSSPKNWYNERCWLFITNTSDSPATVYVFLYKADGSPYNNDPNNGIPITIQPYAEFAGTMDQFYSSISDHWDGNTPLTGFIKLYVPNNGNGTVNAEIRHVQFKGNEGTDPFDIWAYTTTYSLDLRQVAVVDNVHNKKGLITFQMFINKNFNNNDKLDLDGEVVNFLKILNASENDATVAVTYHNSAGGTLIGTPDTFTIHGHGSVSYSPTSPGYGLNSAALQFVNDPSMPFTGFPFNAVITVTSGNPTGIVGQAIELRRHGTYDSIAQNAPSFNQ